MNAWCDEQMPICPAPYTAVVKQLSIIELAQDKIGMANTSMLLQVPLLTCFHGFQHILLSLHGECTLDIFHHIALVGASSRKQPRTTAKYWPGGLDLGRNRRSATTPARNHVRKSLTYQDRGTIERSSAVVMRAKGMRLSGTPGSTECGLTECGLSSPDSCCFSAVKHLDNIYCLI